MKTYTNTPANIENTNARNSEQVTNTRKAEKLEDFGQKIGGARKDLYQAANEWAAKLATITAESLTKAGGVSKLLHLPNLEKMTEAGAITAEQARAALIIWRGFERKPQGIYKADRWAERTRARLEAVADTLTGTEPTAENVADIIKAARESAEFAVITAANWPAVPFTFGAYSVKRSTYSTPAAFRIIGGGYYRGTASTDPADIAAQLRDMTAADAEKAADRRAAGPALGVYHTSDYTRYFIAVEGKCEIVLRVCDTYQEATEAARNERDELLERYEALRNFPALRRAWNRPRIGKEWHAEDVTPEQFTAALPFKGVEFGNWLNQQERAALLNSAFDGFHDLADLLGIPAAAVTLGGRLNFSFATRGHAGSAAHFDSCYNTINLNKRNGAGCMAHEWLHACDHYAAELAGRGGCGSWGAAFSTEYKGETLAATDAAARRLVDAIRNTDYYTRSGNYQAITGKMQGGEAYYTMPCELAARGFEGVVLYLLTKAGGCSDFLVNLQSWRDFERDDAGHRRDCYPYPSDAEAAALLPYYMEFFRALFGRCEVSREAAEGVAAATLQAQQEKAEADRAAAEKAAKEKEESEARRAAQREKLERDRETRKAEQERKAAEVKANAEQTRAAIVETLTARHFDTIATGCDSVAVYAVAHLEGEIYTLCADIATANKEGRAYVETLPAACLNYKRVHNAKRIICRSREIRAHYWNAADMIREELANSPAEVRTVAKCYERYATADNWQHAAKLWADTQRLHEEQAARNQEAAKRHEEKHARNTNTDNSSEPAEGLQLIDTAEGVAVIGNDWKDTYYNKKDIKAHGATWNKERKQWEATDPEAVASLRAWFALRTEEQATAPDTLQQAEDITATPLQDSGEIEETAPVLPEWLKVGARVRTRGRYMMSTHSRRPEWVEGEIMTVRTIGPDFVELESRDESGTLRGLESMATATAAGQLTPIYSASEKLGEAMRKWSANEYAATHHGATLTDWDKAHPAPVEWCKPGQVFKLAGRQIAGRDVYAIITKLGNDCFFYVGNFGSSSEHLAAYSCQKWENLQPVEIMHEDTPKFAKMFQEFHDIRKAWEADGVKIWQEREDKERTAATLFDEQSGKAERQEPAAIAASEEEGAPLAEPNRDGLPDWLHVGTRFCLLDFVTGKPTAVRYTCAAIDYENKTVTIPEAADTFRGGSHVYRWDAFHWATFAPVTDDTDPTPDPSGEGVGVCHNYETGATCYSTSEKSEPAAQQVETGTAGRVKWARNAEVITTEQMGRVDVFEIVDEWPVNYYVWNIGREHFPLAGWLPLAKNGHNTEGWQRNIDRDHLKAIKVQSEAAALACMDYAHHHDRPTREDFLKVLAQYPTDPTPDPSGDGVGVCHSYETGAPCYSTSEKSEPTADPLADIISEAKQQEARTVSGLNYGPINYLRDRVLYATNGKTTAENMAEYESNLHRVTDADTYAAYLLNSYDVFVDETQVYCDLRRAFPSLTFAELCRLIRDHMGENQQGNGIAAALVPDVVILSSSDEYTREKFRERHERFYKLSSYWKGEEVNTNRERDLKKHYDRESLAVHFLLSHELFYSWIDNRHREDCLNDVCAIYPDMTADELRDIRDKYAAAVSEIYG